MICFSSRRKDDLYEVWPEPPEGFNPLTREIPEVCPRLEGIQQSNLTFAVGGGRGGAPSIHRRLSNRVSLGGGGAAVRVPGRGGGDAGLQRSQCQVLYLQQELP